MAREQPTELSVIGGSNAAGIYENTLPDIVLTDVLRQAFLRYKPGANDLVVELNERPSFESPIVLNAGVPGDTVVDMASRFTEDVLNKNPSRVLIWPGLNDSSLITKLYHGGTVEPYGREEVNSAGAYIQATMGVKPGPEYLEKAADFFAENVALMVKGARAQGIEVFVGTIPPYSNLDRVEQTPDIVALRSTGLQTLASINERIRKTSGAQVIDIHASLVDPHTNLNRQENAWGDLLHLSNRGQILVGALAASQILHSRITVTSFSSPILTIG